MDKEPHPNYDPNAIRQSFGVFGQVFAKGSPAGKLTLALVGGVVVMGGFLWVANHLADKEPLTYRSVALKRHVQRQQQLKTYRRRSRLCMTNSAVCIKWTELALQCEKGRKVCGEAEDYRDRMSGVPLSSDPGAYSF